MKMTVLKKVPWRKVIKGVAVCATGAAAMMGAYETDEKVQKVIKMAASKMDKKS